MNNQHVGEFNVLEIGLVDWTEEEYYNLCSICNVLIF